MANKLIGWKYRTGDVWIECEPLSIETNGRATDWYPKMYRQLRDWVTNHDYRNNDYVIELIGWDYDLGSFKNTNLKHQYYIHYIRNDHYPDGVWNGRYPSNALYCDQIVVDDIRDLGQFLESTKQLAHELYDFRQPTDKYLRTLFPDIPSSRSDKIVAASLRSKNRSLQTIQDAIDAFTILNNVNLSQLYPDFPIEYNEYVNDIVARLIEAKAWVSNAVLTK